jgi:hypothetical protein
LTPDRVHGESAGRKTGTSADLGQEQFPELDAAQDRAALQLPAERRAASEGVPGKTGLAVSLVAGLIVEG